MEKVGIFSHLTQTHCISEQVFTKNSNTSFLRKALFSEVTNGYNNAVGLRQIINIVLNKTLKTVNYISEL